MAASTFAQPVINLAGGGGQSFANAAAVVPSDSVPLTVSASALWVGGGGSVAVITLGGQTLTISGIAAGTLIPIAVSQVLLAGTSATLIVALW